MATTILSSKGQVVLPRLVRSKLHLVTGTKLFCEIQGDSVILRPAHARNFVREYVTDPQTGLRVTKVVKNRELVTSDMVKTLL
jgi:AbrB family looped-hinge helix DNA binding protein